MIMGMEFVMTAIFAWIILAFEFIEICLVINHILSMLGLIFTISLIRILHFMNLTLKLELAGWLFLLIDFHTAYLHILGSDYCIQVIFNLVSDLISIYFGTSIH